MKKTFMLIKSRLEEGEVKNHVISQVTGAGKAHHVISQKFAESGVVGDILEIDELGITKRGTEPDTNEQVAFSSVFKGGL